MDLPDDLPPQRRPLFFPVVIATTFLSIIGMSAGLLLGSERDRGDGGGTGAQPPVVSTTRPVDPEPAPTGPTCRKETQVAAENAGVSGPLYEVLRLRTKTSVVYICQNREGDLYYHANNGGDRWIEGETALFLTGVREGPDDYQVTATDGTTFSVNRGRLLIKHPDGTQEAQLADG